MDQRNANVLQDPRHEDGWTDDECHQFHGTLGKNFVNSPSKETTDQPNDYSIMVMEQGLKN